ncbi:MAG: ribosomal protein S18-alanine N-acetyltransferase [Lachnospiraceae bacterium]|nr:ribosomal protein S18-alanine N-acetyltransferase [Lachnospiraceae bacterium]
MIRLAKERDAEELALISERSVDPKWTKEDFLSAFKNPQARVFVCEEKMIVGYGVLYFAADEGEIPSIAVEESYRRNGYGDDILEGMQGFCLEEKIHRIFLEVREGNFGAISFYKKNDFIEVGRRKKFYDHPVEDGLILEKNLMERNTTC